MAGNRDLYIDLLLFHRRLTFQYWGMQRGLLFLNVIIREKLLLEKIKRQAVLRKNLLEKEFVKLWKGERMLSVNENRNINTNNKYARSIYYFL